MIEQDIILFRNGDKKAFERLYRHYVGKVYNFTAIYLKEASDRSDVVQDVFVKLWDKRYTMDETRSLDGLLFIITRNLILNSFRRRGRSVSLSQEGVLDIPSGEDVVDSVNNKLSSEKVSQLIDVLPPRQKEAFILKHQVGLSVKEIAQKMDVSEMTVKRHLNLAMHFIKTNLPLFLVFVNGIK